MAGGWFKEGWGGCYPCAAASFGFTEFTLLGSDSFLERAVGTMCPGTVLDSPRQFYTVLAKSLSPSVSSICPVLLGVACCVLLLCALCLLLLCSTHISLATCLCLSLGIYISLLQSTSTPEHAPLPALFDIPFCICLFAFASLFVDLRPFAILLISSHLMSLRLHFLPCSIPVYQECKAQTEPSGPVTTRRWQAEKCKVSS